MGGMRLTTVAIFSLLLGCTEPMESTPDAMPSECERYCAWEHDLTGVSFEGCVAECQAEDCADCCASTPQWPECA